MGDLQQANEAKSLGSIAWSNGDHLKAIEHFTTAINFLPPTKSSEECRKLTATLYSNRSAAYLKLKRTTEALQDANKCIEADQSWPKGALENFVK
jgi:tetratricopeptide (TPR) repeat protein